VGRPPEKPIVWYHSFEYQAASWKKQRRVVAKIEWHRDELVARVGFIVTNLGGGAARVVKFYNSRGTAERWIKEGKNAVKWTRLRKGRGGGLSASEPRSVLTAENAGILPRR